MAVELQEKIVVNEIKIRQTIEALLQEKTSVIIAIDGRCAAGKTTLAAHLAEQFDCNVIHMDDFFLRPEQRTEERLRTPGENVDHERFLEEVLKPLKMKTTFEYRPYSCRTQSLMELVAVSPKKLTIVEGSYSCHPSLREYYDLRIFLTVSGEEQLRRLALRESEEKLAMFKEKWIPMEEAYFAACHVKESYIC